MDNVIDYTNAMSTGAQTETAVAIVSSQIAEYAEKIKMNWQKAADSISEVAKLCAQANRELSFKDKAELFVKLPFDRTVFSKLAKIGADQRLDWPEVERRLPANYSLQYELTNWSDKELKAAIAEDIINPRAKRTVLQEWVKSHRDKESRPARKERGDDPRWRAVITAWENADLPTEVEEYACSSSQTVCDRSPGNAFGSGSRAREGWCRSRRVTASCARFWVTRRD